MKHYGDITRLCGADLPPVDCITGGSPCQDLSVAGKRAGLAGKRSGLYMEQIRIIREMRQATNGKKPRFMVWENVPGAFSSNKGKDFAAVLEEAIRIVEPQAPDVPVPAKGWPSAGCLYDELGGWSVAWRVHDAQFWGVPQRRKRICLIADFGGQSAPEILFERKGLSGDFEESGAQRERNANSNENCASAPVGNAEVSSSTVVYDCRGNGDGKICPTITGGHQNRVTDYTAICIGNGQVNQSIDTVAGALNCMHDQQLLYAPDIAHTLWAKANCDYREDSETYIVAVDCRNFTESEVNGTLQAKEKGGTSLNLNNVCRVGGIVRRITPLECERLQGYPDGWTNIGTWMDSKMKTREATDTARYTALGNSIALPFWFWALRRISAQYERPATLGSLFDGIGGFPLCWERCNGKGTAIWASEIEEFAIAVTKKHFGGGGDGLRMVCEV